MHGLVLDLRLGVRLLIRDRAFSLAAALTLALCLGANVALFSVVHHVLLRPLPVPDPDRMLLMSNVYPRAGAGDSSNSGVPDYYDRLRETTVFEAQALFGYGSVGLEQDGEPTRVQLMAVTPSFFQVVGVAPALGRAFEEREGEPGGGDAVVVSHALWRKVFAGDPGAIGRDLRLDGRPHRVVGVMPASFDGFSPGVMLWRPLAFTAEQRSDAQRHSNNYWNVGRLRPGATLEQAQAQVDALNAANLERFPQYRELLVNAGFRTVVTGYSDHLLRRVKPTLYLLWGGALFVLLIGCVNVTNLVLVRTRVRAKELATRLALGAGPWRLGRQLVLEGLALAAAAGVLGLGVSALALRAVGAFALEDLPHGSEIGLDAVAVLYAALACGMIGAVMGLLPLAGVLPSALTTLLREESRSTTGGRAARSLRRGLVVTQVAFAFVLLAGAGLLLASFREVLEVDPGFVGEGVTTASVVLPRARYADEDALRRFADESLRQVRALPGVAAAGATDTIPFGDRHSDSVILAEGYEMKPGESVISPSAVNVTPGYFEAMGVRLVRGRFFDERDTSERPRVVIVDRKLAARFWPGQDPVGRRMYLPTDINDLLAVTEKTVFLTVVGVVADVKLHDLAEGDRSVGTYYFPMAQSGSRSLTFAVRATGAGDHLPAAVRTAIAAVDRQLPVFDVQRMTERTERSLSGRRSPALLSMGFGIGGLLLSAVGIYGVLAYLVAQRRREIGIRLALGGSPRRIFELVLREGVLLVAGGFALGGAGTFLLRGALQAQLFGVRSGDPVVLGAAAAALALVALLACALPARRATRIDPRIVLAE